MSEEGEAQMANATPLTTSCEDTISLDITYQQQVHSLTFPSDSTVTDLSNLLAIKFDIPTTNQKLLITPKPGLIRPPFPDASLVLSSFLPPCVSVQPKILLLGATTSTVSALNDSLASTSRARTLRAESQSKARKALPSLIQRTRPSSSKSFSSSSSRYSFASIIPLPSLPDPSRSLAFLNRLANDDGIRYAMQHYKFSVGCLTEMDPAAHTTYNSRTLGLNRNKGEVIELRLWTDAFDGMRDYKTVRRTLCHELAHNVHSEHDGEFWKLMRDIEDLVEKGDWKNGQKGHVLGEDEYSVASGGRVDRDEDGEHIDGGGWTGGSYVLGGSTSRDGQGGLSRREVLAKAAEGRMKQLNEDDKTE